MYEIKGEAYIHPWQLMALGDSRYCGAQTAGQLHQTNKSQIEQIIQERENRDRCFSSIDSAFNL